MPQREDRLDQPHCAGGGLGMSQITLDRCRARMVPARCRKPLPGSLNSTGSPTGVPVPCASTMPDGAGVYTERQPTPPDTPPRARPTTASRCCRCDRPGWRPCHAIRPGSGHHRRSAGSNRLSITTAQPSERTNPSAATSNVAAASCRREHAQRRKRTRTCAVPASPCSRPPGQGRFRRPAGCGKPCARRAGPTSTRCPP